MNKSCLNCRFSSGQVCRRFPSHVVHTHPTLCGEWRRSLGFNNDRGNFIQKMTEMFFTFIQTLVDKFRKEK